MTVKVNQVGETRRYGLVDGPSWVIHAILVAIRKLGPDASTDAIFEWTCQRLWDQCKHWAMKLDMFTAFIALDSPRLQSECWRLEIEGTYKSTRRRGDRDPRVSAVYGRILREFLTADQGLPILQTSQCEAEDVIYHARAYLREMHAASPSMTVTFMVLTRDTDLLQMVDVRGDTRVIDFWGNRIGPIEGQDLLWKKILAGDRSDNIPSIHNWRKLSKSTQTKLLTDPQFRAFWLEEHPDLASSVQKNQQLIDLRCCPEPLQMAIHQLCAQAITV